MKLGMSLPDNSFATSLHLDMSFMNLQFWIPSYPFLWRKDYNFQKLSLRTIDGDPFPLQWIFWGIGKKESACNIWQKYVKKMSAELTLKVYLLSQQMAVRIWNMLFQVNLPSRCALMVGILPRFNLWILAYLHKITTHDIKSIAHVSNKTCISATLFLSSICGCACLL